MYRGRSERRESALSTMIDLKGENPKCHIHRDGSPRPAGCVGHFEHSVIQTKGNSNGDSPAGHVRVLRGADACRGRHRSVVVQEAKGERPMRRARKKTFLALAAALAAAQTALLQAQTPVAPTLKGAVNDIRTIAIAAGTLVAGMVGLIGLGRTAYKLSQGDTDSMTSLIFAIVGIVLGFLANTFIG